ncbi:unnamed protein product, partial [Amoebophrya sp. A25]|eukprot:GSA25T00003538001.1
MEAEQYAYRDEYQEVSGRTDGGPPGGYQYQLANATNTSASEGAFKGPMSNKAMMTAGAPPGTASTTATDDRRTTKSSWSSTQSLLNGARLIEEQAGNFKGDQQDSCENVYSYFNGGTANQALHGTENAASALAADAADASIMFYGANPYSLPGFTGGNGGAVSTSLE